MDRLANIYTGEILLKEFLRPLEISAYFGTTAKFWLGLQDDYDIEEEQKANKIY